MGIGVHCPIVFQLHALSGWSPSCRATAHSHVRAAAKKADNFLDAPPPPSLFGLLIVANLGVISAFMRLALLEFRGRGESMVIYQLDPPPPC